mmetsp:Transcript_44432/g.104309  ORF Transcript_44432/g.104309 Transcript_44432/m.104309 type:complete len:139 (-) Transcript_44432:195-611(-)
MSVFDRVEGDGLILRPFSIEDAANLTKLCNSEAIAKNLRDKFPHPYTIDDATFFLKNIAKPGVNFAIDWTEGAIPQTVGSISLDPREDVERVGAEVGYYIGEEFWGKGLATRAVKLLSRRALSPDTGLERVACHASPP